MTLGLCRAADTERIYDRTDPGRNRGGVPTPTTTTAAFGVIQPAPLETTTRPIPPLRPTFHYSQQHALGEQEMLVQVMLFQGL
jgi:hypothetical protein